MFEDSPQFCVMVLPVVAYGDSVLRRMADEIQKGHPKLDQLIEDMWATMYASEGVGLAAPQIGQSIRMFIVDGAPFAVGENGDKGCEGFKRVFINPLLFDQSEEMVSMEEGCLSIPGVREEVVRPVGLHVEYYDENWVLREEELEGIAARIVQHENDHLDGVMIPDHVSPLRKTLLQGRLKDIGKGKVDVDYRMRFPKKLR
jgi:peptide deformylase